MEQGKLESANAAAGSSNKSVLELYAVALGHRLRSGEEAVYAEALEELTSMMRLRERLDPCGLLPEEEFPGGSMFGAGVVLALIIAGIGWLFFNHINIAWRP